MQRCFIDCATAAIRIDNVGEPDSYELDENSMELPGPSTYMLSSSSARTGGPLKIEDWFEERKNSIKAWPLMSFSEFLLSFCRHAIRLCSKSSNKAGSSSELCSFERVRRYCDSIAQTYGPVGHSGTRRITFHVPNVFTFTAGHHEKGDIYIFGSDDSV